MEESSRKNAYGLAYFELYTKGRLAVNELIVSILSIEWLLSMMKDHAII